jgi:hypothetical protein
LATCTTCGSAVQPGTSCVVDGQVAPLNGTPLKAPETEAEHIAEQKAVKVTETAYRATPVPALTADDLEDTKPSRPIPTKAAKK